MAEQDSQIQLELIFDSVRRRYRNGNDCAVELRIPTLGLEERERLSFRKRGCCFIHMAQGRTDKGIQTVHEKAEIYTEP